MKRTFLTLAFIVGISAAGFADEFTLYAGEGANVAPVAGSTTIYSFFVNIVAEPFRFFLIGFFNLALGNHNLPQLGFVNTNTGNFTTVQAGFVNTVGGNFTGAQYGFINTSMGNTSGAQFGFINTSMGEVRGAQFGFINTSRGEVIGGQFGHINTSMGDTFGAQFGFINTSMGRMRGTQFGFVNSSVGALNGMQLGFINFADSIEDGIPIGFISIVRNGGFRAVEYVFSEFFPVGVGLKLGVERFYTTIYVSYSTTGGGTWENYFATGFGIGSIIPIGESFFFNPELTSFTPLLRRSGVQQLMSFVPLVGFNINRHFSVTAGPSVTWSWAEGDTGVPREPFFSIVSHDINDRHSIVVGARAGLRFRF